MRNKRGMLLRFDLFVKRMDDQYAAVRACLVQDDYVGAQAILARMGISHAKTSMSLRNLLVREGMLEEE